MTLLPSRKLALNTFLADRHLIGSGESGKSTIVKQMKIIHQNGFTEQERMDYRPVIYKNLTESAQAIVLAMRKLGVSPQDPTNRVRPSRPPPFVV
jgi:guanine nucleotide-binding protein G(i) subunit alpha